ncbi:unnamed protein product [Caenorhabditis sp. 36 PRJEB53466]|nr:unnamed protein product [Caenorhabditis sp. 36 PRJEB53466]
MSTFPYERMAENERSMWDRLRLLDCRVWFFLLALEAIFWDICHVEYFLQYGITLDTSIIFVYFAIDGLYLAAAYWNHPVLLKCVKVITIFFLLSLSVIATIGPVWMVFDFNQGAPEMLSALLDHNQETTHMKFGRKLAYCVYWQIYVLYFVALNALQLYLVQRILKETQKKQVALEMDNFV